MIFETIECIKKAEAETAEEMARALEDAKETVQKAEAEAERIRKETVTATKEERAKVIETAYAEGEKQFVRIVESGKRNVLRLTEQTDVDKAVALIKKKVMSGYVGR